MDDTINIHATSVRLAAAAAPFAGPPDCGILLLGPAGSGKTDVALRLIAMGAQLIADDRTLLTRRGHHVYAHAPETIAGLLEARGIGILRMPHAGPTLLVLAVRLSPDAPMRMPEPAFFSPHESADWPGLPVLTLPAFEASTPAKIAAACAAAARSDLFTGRN